MVVCRCNGDVTQKTPQDEVQSVHLSTIRLNPIGNRSKYQLICLSKQLTSKLKGEFYESLVKAFDFLRFVIKV